MNSLKSILVFLMLISVIGASAQDFYGFVKKDDSVSTPIFQAIVEIVQGGKATDTVRTYFDGSFKFTPVKSQSYLIHISYAGYTDTTYTFTTDKKGVPSDQNIIVHLKKDGMRLIGIIRSHEENFPIEDVTIVLKNIMTRKEDRITTGISGAYNFKLEYETNYRISIDKRSVGVMNKYRDTVFYISTVGFNQPLDYKLDIYLEPDLYPNTKPRDGYDPERQPDNKNLKPAFGNPSSYTRTHEERQPFKEEKLKEAEATISKLQAELEQKHKELEKAKKKVEAKASKQEEVSASIVSEKKQQKTKKKVDAPEVVIIRDTPINREGASVRENKEQEDELELTRKKALEKRSSAAVLVRDTGITTSSDTATPKINNKGDKKVKIVSPTDTVATAVNKNLVIEKPPIKEEKIIQKPVVADTSHTINPNVRMDTTKIPQLTPAVLTKTQQVIDTIKQKPTTNQSVSDSVPQKSPTPYLTKSQEELIKAAEAFALQKKLTQDSIAREMTKQELLKRELQKK